MTETDPTIPTDNAPEGTPAASATPESNPGATSASAATPPPSSPGARGPLAARGQGMAKPASPSVSTEDLEKQSRQADAKNEGKPKKKQAPRPRVHGDKPAADKTDSLPSEPPRHRRSRFPIAAADWTRTLQAELDAELAAMDFESVLSGDAGMADRKEPLTEGGRVQAVVLKIHEDSVFVALGGPDEGVVPFEMFKEEPVVGSTVEVVIRSFSNADGLFSLGLPGAAVEVSEWEDIEEGSVVTATVTASNTGGLECSVGKMKAFMPISQIADYRVEDAPPSLSDKRSCASSTNPMNAAAT